MKGAYLVVGLMAQVLGIFGILSWVYWYLVTFRHWELQVNVALFPLACIAMFGSISGVTLSRMLKSIDERLDQQQQRIDELETQSRQPRS